MAFLKKKFIPYTQGSLNNCSILDTMHLRYAIFCETHCCIFCLTCYFPNDYLSSALCLSNEQKVWGNEINLSETMKRQPCIIDLAGEQK